MRVLFATAELAPLARVGGLAEAAAGLVGALRTAGVDVAVALPHYGPVDGDEIEAVPLAVPSWAPETTVRRIAHPVAGEVLLIDQGATHGPHPYLADGGAPHVGLEARFLAFSAAVGALVDELEPDVVHVNDWHTSAVLGLHPSPPPSVLTIHNLAFQGVTERVVLDRLARRREAFEWFGVANLLAGAVRLADRVVAVSPTYAREILEPAHGMGLHDELAARADALVGIRNGIDVDEWRPPFGPDELERKSAARAQLVARFGIDLDDSDPLFAMVTRLTDQKGVDLALRAARHLPGVPAGLVALGAGDADLARAATDVAASAASIGFVDGYDADLAHQIFEGADLLLMPSRFEPCGLAQMQAMVCGTIPVVTDVGGLHDTVVDADVDPRRGTGIVADHVDAAAVTDACWRAARLWRDRRRRSAVQRRGMTTDWSWAAPAAEHVRLYEEIT